MDAFVILSDLFMISVPPHQGRKFSYSSTLSTKANISSLEYKTDDKEKIHCEKTSQFLILNFLLEQRNPFLINFYPQLPTSVD